MSSQNPGVTGPRAFARTGDMDTSHEAAARLGKDKLTATQKAVGVILSRFGPLTDEQLIEKWREQESLVLVSLPGASDQSIRSRRSELVRLGMIFEIDKVVNSGGNRTTRWGTKKHLGSRGKA